MGKYAYTAEFEVKEIDNLEFELTDSIYPILKPFSGDTAFAVSKDDNFHFPLGTSYLTYGIPGIISLARAKASEAEDNDSKELYEGIAAVYEKLADVFRRFSLKLRSDSVNETDHKRVSNMNAAADMFESFAREKPACFRDALGLEMVFWLIRANARAYAAKPRKLGGACIGCMDRHLLPFYEKDISAGRLTDEEALSYIKEAWMLMNHMGSGETRNNLTVGGVDTDGKDVSSKLSVLMVRASIELSGYSEPHVNVRCHKNMDPELFEAMIELQRMGEGQGTLCNDDVTIPAMLRRGYKKETACLYTPDGCTEIMADGHSTIDIEHVDVVGAVELTFNNGKFIDFRRKESQGLYTSGQSWLQSLDAVTGFESGSIDDASSYEKVYEAFLRQYKYQSYHFMNKLKEFHERRGREATGSIFANGTFSDVLESGIGMFCGGLSETCYQIFSGSIPTAADCLAAIKKVVFEDKRYTIPEIRKALEADYAGYETMQAELKAAPKFGCDNDEVDLIAADIAQHFCEWTEEYSAENGVRILPAVAGWKFLSEAYAVAATPDGRNYGDSIAEHFNATPGNAKLGPTAVLLSVAKAPLHLAAGTASTFISLPSGMFYDADEAQDVLRMLNRSAMNLDIMYMNIAIYDVNKLRDAQKHPEHYSDLIVRVWGFSARFIDLSLPMQNHVISRVENTGT